MRINSSICLFAFFLVLFLQTANYPALAQTTSNCNRQEEIFGFEMPNYAISHQSGAILNIKVRYRLTPEASAKNDYPNFVPMTKEIGNYLTNFPNNNDFWEVVNKKLVKILLDKYPQMSSLKVELAVMPTPNELFPRSSILRSTRPQGCPITIGY